MSEQESDYELTAKRFLSRSKLQNPHSQTTSFVSKILRVQRRLADLEKQLAGLSIPNVPVRWEALSEASAEYDQIAEEIHVIQRTAANPRENLHDAIEISPEEIEENAISQILTLLGWNNLDTVLDRLFRTFDRLGQSINAKRQERLTRLIVIFSAAAFFVSLVSIAISF